VAAPLVPALVSPLSVPVTPLLRQVMLQDPPPVAGAELAVSALQGAITLGLALLGAHLFRRYRRPWFGWFAAAWGIYVARLLCILSFLLSGNRVWLYWHQVTTGWTALVLLWASLVFLRQPRAHPALLAVGLFPPLWSYLAIYQLDNFLWAALPAVLFLSGATLWTGWVFWRYQRTAGSSGARLLAVAFLLWGVHHLDYPFLRAQGAWMPWGYYLDIAFELLVGVGFMLLVLNDLGRGVQALTALSGDLQRPAADGDRARRRDPLVSLLSRPLTLPGVRGSAMVRFDDVEPTADVDPLPVSRTGERAVPRHAGGRGGARVVRGAGSCVGWEGRPVEPAVAAVLARMQDTRRPQVAATQRAQPFVAALPVSAGQRLVGALVMVGEVRNPFTALDDAFLLALGQQVGAALEQDALDRQLAARTAALEQLSARMVRQHEEERRRLSRELHDETAQVFSAVKMQLEALRGIMPGDAAPRVDRLRALVDTGIASIRQVTSDLRPSLLDDLGLLPALRSLVTEFTERTGVPARLAAPATLPALGGDADLALFRALQEALANVTRHAGATAVEVEVAVDAAGDGARGGAGAVRLAVTDNGRGFPEDEEGRVDEGAGRMGLTGMRERIHGVGGEVRVRNVGGAQLRIVVPVAAPGAGGASGGTPGGA
jgi:signal transduction histidine kinase